jgi:hypothetical protein
MDKHANIYFDADEHRFAVTDNHGKPIGNTIFNRHRRADAFRDAIVANTDSDGNAAAFFYALIDAYRDANGITYEYGYAGGDAYGFANR